MSAPPDANLVQTWAGLAADFGSGSGPIWGPDWPRSGSGFEQIWGRILGADLGAILGPDLGRNRWNSLGFKAIPAKTLLQGFCRILQVFGRREGPGFESGIMSIKI